MFAGLKAHQTGQNQPVERSPNRWPAGPSASASPRSVLVVAPPSDLSRSTIRWAACSWAFVVLVARGPRTGATFAGASLGRRHRRKRDRPNQNHGHRRSDLQGENRHQGEPLADDFSGYRQTQGRKVESPGQSYRDRQMRRAHHHGLHTSP